MSDPEQLWHKRQEIPDPQTRGATDEYEAARKFLLDQPLGSSHFAKVFYCSFLEFLIERLKAFIEQLEGGFRALCDETCRVERIGE